MAHKQKMEIKSRYTLAQKLRFPLIFGSILGVFLTGFINRRKIFGDEIEEVRQRNVEESQRQQAILSKAKEEVAGEVAARARTK